MAKTWSLADANFPTIQADEDARESVQKIVNYMAILSEQLKYSLNRTDRNGTEAEEAEESLRKQLSALEQRVTALEQRGEEADETA